MKIPIQSAHLTDSPYNTAQAEAFLFDDQYTVDQLIFEFNHGLAGAYLVSGYRGSGKTSFINRLNERLTDFIFVELNISKATPYPVLLKRIIRQLYIEYQSYCQKQKKTSADFMPEFQLLYDRTFNEVTQINIDSNKSELKTERQTKFDVTKLKEPFTKLFAPVFLALFSATGLLAQLTSAVLFVILLVASFIWTLLSAWTLTTTRTDANTKSNDLSRKSLYDDEIAEHHLFVLLQKMKDKKLKLVLVFDELDKLETNEEVKKIVNDLKPLLLSGYAHCLVVAGQALYYDLEKSAYLDDIVISSLFSRTIHVAFLKNATLKKFCLGLVIKKENESIQQIVSDYFDALILQSGRNPRKLVNAIRSRLIWEEDRAYIEIDETQQEKFRWRARVLQAAASVVDNDLATRVRNNVQLDFFTAQVFSWGGKMMTYDSTSFQKANIYDESNYGDSYPKNWIEELDVVWNTLLEGLKKESLLATGEVTDDNSGGSRYNWIFTVPVPIQIKTNTKATTKTTTQPTDQKSQSRFLTDFTELEMHLRRISREVGNAPRKNTQGFKQLVNTLTKVGVLQSGWFESPAVSSVNDLRNMVAHGEVTGDKLSAEIRNARSTLPRLWAEVNQQYTLYLAKLFFKNDSFNLTTEGGFDILGELANTRLALEVKTYRSSKVESRIYTEIADKYYNSISLSPKQLIYALFLFQTGSKNNDEIQIFQEQVNRSLKQNAENIYFFPISLDDEANLKFQIEEGFMQMRLPSDFMA